MKLESLYIRDSKNKARVWNVHTEGPEVVVVYGLVDGKQVEQRTTCKAKNIGKVNETTPEEQAELEAQSKWNKQVDREDYNVDIDLAGLQLRPQLALDYTKVPHRVDKSKCVAQPKLDGVRLVGGPRCTRKLEGFDMLTRKGETYGLPHISPESEMFRYEVNQTLRHSKMECLGVDGEAYLHGLTCGEILSLSRKYQKGETEKLEFHLFDLIIPNMGFLDRYDVLAEVYDKVLVGNDTFDLVPCFELGPETFEDDLARLHGEFTEQGYEGLMIRHSDGLYRIGDRSPDLFKYKHFYDKECKIVDVWEDKNGNAMLNCLFDHNDPTSQFDCTPKRTHPVRKAMLKQKGELIDQWITVKYQEISYATNASGLPTFPVGLALRECDDEGNPIV